MAVNEPTPAIDPTTGHARELEARVIAQVARDPAFRARVVADPQAAFAEMGLSIPVDVQIQTLEESAEQYYLVLPSVASTSGAGARLSDAQLEAVAGGDTGSDSCYPTSSYSSTDTGWTGCASGQSGCLA